MKVLIGIAVAVILGLGGIMVTHDRGGPASSGSHAKIQTISTGGSVDLAAHLRAGTWTMVEFTAEW